VARRSARARGAFLHVYDEGAGTFTTIAVSGASDRALVGQTTDVTDPVLRQGISAANAVSVDAGEPGLARASRYGESPPKRCVLCCVAHGPGGIRGAIELVDPLDRGEFDASDGYTLTYVSERWSEVLAKHGR
jgi:hypothetical protein